jgi:hypothetical protein
MEKDLYFITKLSRRGEDWPQFHEIPIGILGDTQFIYVQRYVIPNIDEPIDFLVVGG